MDIKEVKYTENTLVKTIFTLNVDENNSIINYDNMKIKLSKEETNLFIDKLIKIISTWDEFYYTFSNELDKTTWTLQITFSNNKIKKYEGNTRPSNYQALLNLIGEVVNNELI